MHVVGTVGPCEECYVTQRSCGNKSPFSLLRIVKGHPSKAQFQIIESVLPVFLEKAALHVQNSQLSFRNIALREDLPSTVDLNEPGKQGADRSFELVKLKHVHRRTYITRALRLSQSYTGIKRAIFSDLDRKSLDTVIFAV